jgi:hypothetical protein
MSDRAGHVPAHVVVSGSRGDRNPGLHLEAGDERFDSELARDGRQLRRRCNRRPQRSAAMDGGPIGIEGVVEVHAASMQKTRPESETGPACPIASVNNALLLLLLFREQPRVRLTDACKYLGVAHSTAHRLLAMLAGPAT